ncbi:hypothetical protein E1B28_000726 [Marasmius oreades]|uniref:Uncharacterized protein n=1 Tax=Marasmius oreades TaxID=181124 RepID=A0A9P7V234_9AGAR|nr:uncharacterized protein E1B28_000726 [Marasmius oreades]KAG7098822.1 hypothetical protein E1B28_000726 [Marasmius oreades]
MLQSISKLMQPILSALFPCGSDEALTSLLWGDRLPALLEALKETFPNRLNRYISNASAIRNEAQPALDILFRVDSLDIVLPYLPKWVPPEDRLKEIKSRRRWEKEKASAHSVNAPGRQGGWVVRRLIGLLGSRVHKVQEAALLTLAASPLADKEIFTSVINAIARSRIADVQLAGCMCVTHTIRAPSLPSSLRSYCQHYHQRSEPIRLLTFYFTRHHASPATQSLLYPLPPFDR